ncbi:MAG: hypothetical protein SF051_04535 [Elusimicrobiota bacterium]|nr:hypothetical protein [Elusimicrobiota bacterium]
MKPVMPTPSHSRLSAAAERRLLANALVIALSTLLAGGLRAETVGPCWCRTATPASGARINTSNGTAVVTLTPEGYFDPESCSEQYPIWGFTEGGEPRSAMSVDGSGFATGSCGGPSQGVQSCVIPATLEDGQHTAETRCIPLAEGVAPFSHTFTFEVDNTPPTVSITQPTADSIQPVINFHTTGASDGTSVELNIGGVIRTVSGNWSLEFTQNELAHLVNQTTTSLTRVQLSAAASDGLNSASTSVSFFLDGVGPTIGIIEPGVGAANLSVIGGTARDLTGVDRMSISIRDLTAERSWNPDTRQFDSVEVIESNLTIDSNLPDTDTLWSYNLLTARYLRSGHDYEITVTAFDQFENKSIATRTLSFSRSLTSIFQPPIVFGGARTATFSPANLSVVWGGGEQKSFCIEFAESIRNQDNWKDKIQIFNEDNTLRFTRGWACNSDLDKLEVTVRSNPRSCLRQGTIRAYFDSSIIGEAVVAIQAPHRTFANLPANQKNLGVGHVWTPTSTPAQECSLFGLSAPCRGDRWNWQVDAGPFQPPLNTQDPRTANVRWVENQRRLLPLTRNGSRVPMCRGNIHVQSQAVPLPLGWDDVATGSPLPKNCGSESQQGVTFIVTSGADQGNCEFITGIRKTAYFHANHDIETTRSDVP